LHIHNQKAGEKTVIYELHNLIRQVYLGRTLKQGETGFELDCIAMSWFTDAFFCSRVHQIYAWLRTQS
jgi:hypothetical protein